MQQSTLFANNGTRKELINIPVECLVHSPFNPRRVRPDADVEKLANRMLANGYEITRAVWAHPVNEHYEVFAGGTRLEAAKQANLAEIPVVLHTGFDDAEIVRLADQDNENDEYHAPVPIVDVWKSYADLAALNWTQAQIAQAKGVTQAFVSYRLALAQLPDCVLENITRYSINEGQAREIIKVSHCYNLTAWLDRETAMLEVIEIALKKTAFTAKDFQNVVTEYNAFIETAQKYADSLDDAGRAKFIAQLAKSKARNMAKVRAAIDVITKEIATERRRAEEEARIAQSRAEAARVEAERAERLVKEWETWQADNVTILKGDFRRIGQQIPDESIDLIFTDPPYDAETIPLYGDLAAFAARVLKPNGSLITYVGHYAIPEVMPLMTPHLRYWWLLAVDHSGSAARLPGKWVFVHWKPLLWFVKGGRRDNEYIADQINSQQTAKDLHPWQQDTTEATYYIEHLTQPGETVLDPFAGSGTTLIAGLQLNRRVIGVDIAEQHIDTMTERIRSYYEATR